MTYGETATISEPKPFFRRYWLVSYSARDWQDFVVNGSTVIGLPKTCKTFYQVAVTGDRIICYVKSTKQFTAILELQHAPYLDCTERPWSSRLFRIRAQVKEICAVSSAEDGVPMSAVRRQLLVGSTENGKLQRLSMSQQNGCEWPVEDGERIFQQFAAGPTEVVRLQSLRAHGRLQAELAILGAKANVDILPAREDRKRLRSALPEDICFLEDLPEIIRLSAPASMSSIDMLYFQHNSVLAAFEIECSTAIYSGLLRFKDLAESFSQMQPEFYILAPRARQSRVIETAQRPAIRNFCRKYDVKYISAEDFEASYENVISALRKAPMLTANLSFFTKLSIPLGML